MSELENQTLALAGLFQCAALIDQMSTSGDTNQAAFDCSLIFQLTHYSCYR